MKNVMTRMWENTAVDPGALITEIRRQAASFEKNIGKKPTRVYIGAEELKSLAREQQHWKIEVGPGGESRARLLGLLCFQVKITEHIHVSYSRKDKK